MADTHETLIAALQTLDSLWIRYLDLLDQYTKAQTAIQKSLGQGFFSLAQANFTSPGRRYGRDHYDQRAIASARVQIEGGGPGSGNEDAEHLVLRMKIIASKSSLSADKGTSCIPILESEDGKSQQEATNLPTPEQTPQPEGEDEKQEPQIDEKEDGEQRRPSDPLRQFGILLPTAIRSAQKSFMKAVQDEDATIQAVNAARAMRETEVEIRRARKVFRAAEKAAAAESGK